MKNFKKIMLNPVVANYLILSFLIMLAVSFSSATYIPFLINRGMNLWKINLINAFFMGTIVLMEVPTGSFADNFGRHRSFTISCFFIALGCLIYFFSGNFWLFILSETVIGLGITFSSGALEAWFVDSLKAQNNIHLKDTVFRQEAYWTSAGAIIGSITGAYFGNFNLAYPWLMNAILITFVGIYSLTLKEHYKNQDLKSERVGLVKQMKLACKFGFSNRKLVDFMILSAILAISVQALNMQWTVVFQKQFHLETKYLGWIFAGIALISAWGGQLSKHGHRFIKDEKKSLAFTLIITAIMIIIITQVSGLFMTLGFFFLHEIGRGAFGPLKKSFFNNHLVSETRATVISLDSMINKVGCLIGLLLSGFLANNYSIKVAWLASGIFLLAAALYFFIPRRRLIKETDHEEL